MHLFSCQAPGGVFQQMLQARRQPKLIVRLKSANSKTGTQLRWEDQRGKPHAELEHMHSIMCYDSVAINHSEMLRHEVVAPPSLLHLGACLQCELKVFRPQKVLHNYLIQFFFRLKHISDISKAMCFVFSIYKKQRFIQTTAGQYHLKSISRLVE